MGYRYFRYKGTPSDSEWLAEHTFEDHGVSGSRPPTPVTLYLLPLRPDDGWTRMGPGTLAAEYDEVAPSMVPVEVRRLAAARLNESYTTPRRAPDKSPGHPAAQEVAMAISIDDVRKLVREIRTAVRDGDIDTAREIERKLYTTVLHDIAHVRIPFAEVTALADAALQANEIDYTQ